MSTNNQQVNLLFPAQCADGSTLIPGWYDREKIPEAAFIAGLVYFPPEIPIPGHVPEVKDADIQSTKTKR